MFRWRLDTLVFSIRLKGAKWTGCCSLAHRFNSGKYIFSPIIMVSTRVIYFRGGNFASHSHWMEKCCRWTLGTDRWRKGYWILNGIAFHRNLNKFQINKIGRILPRNFANKNCLWYGSLRSIHRIFALSPTPLLWYTFVQHFSDRFTCTFYFQFPKNVWVQFIPTHSHARTM